MFVFVWVCVFLIIQTLTYQRVYGIHVCMVCLFSLDVLRQGQTQHFLFHMRTVHDTHKHARTHTNTPLALICCDRAVISALLTLWASFPPLFSPSYPFGLRSQNGVHQPPPPAASVCLRACVCVCVDVFAFFSMQVSLRGLVSESN